MEYQIYYKHLFYLINIFTFASSLDCLATDYITVDNRNVSASDTSSIKLNSSVPPALDDQKNYDKVKRVTNFGEIVGTGANILGDTETNIATSSVANLLDLSKNSIDCVKVSSSVPCVSAINSGAKLAKDVVEGLGKTIPTPVSVGLTVIDVGESGYKAADAIQKKDGVQTYRYGADVIDKGIVTPAITIISLPYAAGKKFADAICTFNSDMNCTAATVTLVKQEVDAYDEFGIVFYPGMEEIDDKTYSQLRAMRASDRRREFDQMQAKHRRTEEDRRAVEDMKRVFAEQKRQEDAMSIDAREATFVSSMNSLLNTTMQTPMLTPTGYQQSHPAVWSPAHSVPSGGAAPSSAPSSRYQHGEYKGCCPRCAC